MIVEKYPFIIDGLEVGNVNLINDGSVLFIDLLEINEEYRNNGYGSRISDWVFMNFPSVSLISGYSSMDILDGFWSKQEGFQYVGEHSEREGYFHFEINKPVNH